MQVLVGVVVLSVQIDTVGPENACKNKACRNVNRRPVARSLSACRAMTFGKQAHQITRKARQPHHALRRDELCWLKVKDFKNERLGVAHLKVSGRGGKTRYVPLHPAASGCVLDYLEAAGHMAEDSGALFRGVHPGRTEPRRRSRPMRSTRSSGPTRRRWGSRSGRTRCGRRLRPTRWITKPTSPRSKNGSGTRTSRRPGSTTTERPGPRTVRPSRSRTEGLVSTHCGHTPHRIRSREPVARTLLGRRACTSNVRLDWVTLMSPAHGHPSGHLR